MSLEETENHSTTVNSGMDDAPRAGEPGSGAEAPKPVGDSPQEASRAFIMAAARNLWLGGAREPEAPKPHTSSGDKRPFPGKDSIAKMKKSLWSNMKKRMMDEPSRREGEKETTVPEAELPAKTVDNKARELAARVQRLTIELAAATRKRIETEEALKKRADDASRALESLPAIQKQNADREQELQNQIEHLKSDLTKVSPDLEQARKQLEEEQARRHELQEQIDGLQKQIQVTTEEREKARQDHEVSALRAQPENEAAGQGTGAAHPPLSDGSLPSGRGPGPDRGPMAPGMPADAPPPKDSYTAYWKLKCLPFESAPDSTFFFESNGHREGIARVLFSIQNRKSLSVLTGEYGSGKSVLCQTVIKRLASDPFKTALISNPRMDALDLTREMAHQFGEDIRGTSRYDILHAFNALLDRCHAANQHCAAIIDEAQVITDPSVLEDLRLLLNHQVGGVTPLTLVFVGQSELNDMLRSIPQLYQRINMKFHVPHLGAGEVRDYVKHRLETAGGTMEIFDEQAVVEVERLSQGNPREINAICDVALLISALSARPRVSVEEITESGKERA